MEIVKTIGNNKYRYLKLGAGQKKLLFLWGFSSYKENPFDLVVRNLNDYTVLIPEYPHHNGFEDVVVDLIDIESVADYLLPLLVAESFTDFYAIGFSFGGLVLIDLTKRFPNLQITKAVVWSSPVLGDSGLQGITRLLSQIYAVTRDERLKMLHGNVSLKSMLQDRGIKLLKPYWFKKYLLIIKSFVLGVLAKETSYLFIYDPLDALVSIKNARYIKKLADHGNVELVEIRGGGHFGTKTGWAKALAKIKDFLDK